jgi:hypothetical protein
MMRMPTAPGVFDDIGHRRVVRVDRLDNGESAGMGSIGRGILFRSNRHYGPGRLAVRLKC